MTGAVDTRFDAAQRFDAATKRLDDGTPVVSVVGEVDRAVAPALEQVLLGVPDDEIGKVIVDLTGCSLLDSRGLSTLVKTGAPHERPGQLWALALTNPTIIKVLQVTGFDELFEIYPSVGAALASRTTAIGHD